MKKLNIPFYKDAIYRRSKGERVFRLTTSCPFWELNKELIISRPFSPKYVDNGIALIIESPNRKNDQNGLFSGLRNLTLSNWYQGDIPKNRRSKQGAKRRIDKDMILAQIQEDANGDATMLLVHVPKFVKYPTELPQWVGRFIETVVNKRGRNG